MTDLVTNSREIQSLETTTTENGVLFNYGDESTYPPEYTFVVINLLPNVPVYYDRKQNTWWTAIADKDAVDIFARNELYGHDEDGEEIYWQPIRFKKSEVLFIPAEKAKNTQ